MSLIRDLTNKTSHCVKYLLKEEAEECYSIKGIYLRKIIAPILRKIYKRQTMYEIKVDSRAKLPFSKKGRIFVLNHRQADDIVIGANVVNKSAYIVFGNKYLALETINGVGLWAYGMILFDRDNKIHRKSVYNKMKYIIEHGGNIIIIYPEGYWNLDDDGEKDQFHEADAHNSENWLIQDFNMGVFRLSKEIGCEIVPVILHYDEQIKLRCYGKRGVPFKVYKTDDIFEKKQELLTKMNTMYYELMEKYSFYQRRDLEKEGINMYEQWANLKKKLVLECSVARINYHLDLCNEKLIGKAKVVNGVTTINEVNSWIR